MSRTRSVPINHKAGIEGVRVDVLLENNKIEELTLPPGVFVSDVLRARGYEGEFIEYSVGLGRLNY